MVNGVTTVCPKLFRLLFHCLLLNLIKRELANKIVML